MKATPLCIALGVLLLSATRAEAQQRSEAEALSIAQRTMERVGLVATSAQLAAARTAQRPEESATASYYVFNGDDDSGFVIVAGDQRLPDVVGYSLQGAFSTDDLPPALQSFLDAYATWADSLAAGNAEALRLAEMSKALQSTSLQSQVVSPLLGGIVWGQGEPFSNLCPTLSGSHCVTGCVATAMAQIMKYHQWPATLPTDLPAYTSSYVGTVSGISAGVAYNWDNMLDSYNGSYTDEEAEAVATLMLHCGVANQMRYDLSSSSAYDPLTQWADYFAYDPHLLQTLDAWLWGMEEWSAMLRNELVSGRPVYFSGDTSDGSAHAFVCDGADGNGLYHLNWGWCGKYNGFYDLSVLGYEGDDASGYSHSGVMIVGITPDNGVEDEPLYPTGLSTRGCSQFSFSKDTRTSATATFSGTATFILRNYSTDAFSGHTALAIQATDGTLTTIASQRQLSLDARTTGSVKGVSRSFSFSYAFPTGRVYVVPVFSTDGGDTWEPCIGSDLYGVELSVTATTVDSVARTLSAALEPTEELLSGLTNQLTLTLSNETDMEYSGLVYFYGNTTKIQPTSPTATLYVRIPAGTSQAFDLDIDTGTATNYYAWVDDWKCNALISTQLFSVTANDTPELTLTSLTTNASATDYETEDAYYQGNQVKVPIIHDSLFILNTTIENTGGTYHGDFIIKKRELNNSGSYTYYPLRTLHRTIPAQSTATFADTLLATEFDTQLANVDITKESDGISLATMEDASRIYFVASPTRYYTFDSDRALGWFEEDLSSAIRTAVLDGGATLSVAAQQLILTSAASAASVSIHSLSGQLVGTLRVAPGGSATLTLPPGIYIVGGRKVLVR